MQLTEFPCTKMGAFHQIFQTLTDTTAALSNLLLSVMTWYVWAEVRKLDVSTGESSYFYTVFFPS